MHHYGTAPTERLGRETRTFPVGARSSRQETCGQCLVATLIDNTLVSLQCVISATSIGNQPIRPSVVVWDLLRPQRPLRPARPDCANYMDDTAERHYTEECQQT